jgi:hypothetical protein
MAGVDDAERAQALRNWAHGDHSAEAAVELLVWHGSWPQKLDAGGYLTVTRGRIRPSRLIGHHAQPDLLRALADVNSPERRLRVSSVDHRILALAASFAFGHEVSLAWALDLLTPEQSSAVLAVFARALPHAYR